MVPAIQDISTEQSTATEDAIAKCKMLMDYAAAYPEAIIYYYESDMILHINSDAAYLVKEMLAAAMRGIIFTATQYSIDLSRLVRPDQSWQIVILPALLDNIITWYHQVK
jgi:hypothetical protein